MHISHPATCRSPRLSWAGPRPIGAITAPILDRLADAELQHGHHARAEQLAQLAAAMREGGA